MKSPKPKPMKPYRRWAMVDVDGEPLWVATRRENNRRYARYMSRLFHQANRVMRVLITEVTFGHPR